MKALGRILDSRSITCALPDGGRPDPDVAHAGGLAHFLETDQRYFRRHGPRAARDPLR